MACMQLPSCPVGGSTSGLHGQPSAQETIVGSISSTRAEYWVSASFLCSVSLTPYISLSPPLSLPLSPSHIHPKPSAGLQYMLLVLPPPFSLSFSSCVSISSFTKSVPLVRCLVSTQLDSLSVFTYSVLAEEKKGRKKRKKIWITYCHVSQCGIEKKHVNVF